MTERNVTTEASSRLLTLGMEKGSPEQSSATEHLPATHKALGLIPSMKAEWGLEKRAIIQGIVNNLLEWFRKQSLMKDV